MKFTSRRTYPVDVRGSHPVRGAWIEIILFFCGKGHTKQSHPVRGAWIEIAVMPNWYVLSRSRTP